MSKEKSTRAEGFRARAEEFLRKAAASNDQATRSQYLELATSWAELAQKLENWEKSKPK